MAKGRTTVFYCQSCGYESPKWMGQCPGCREWNTFVEETVEKKSAGKAREERKAAAAPVNSMDIARSAANFFFMIDILL